MKRLYTTFTVILFVLGCTAIAADEPSQKVIRYKELLTHNQESIAKLALGMSKEDVIALMGSDSAKTKNGMVLNPVRIEVFTSGDDKFEKMFYVTSAHHMFGTVNDSQTTPIVLKNGKVIGWGRDASDAITGKRSDDASTEKKP